MLVSRDVGAGRNCEGRGERDKKKVPVCLDFPASVDDALLGSY